MAETIRDVVIKIALQQVETKLKPPDFSPVKKGLADYEKSVGLTTKRVIADYKKQTDALMGIRKEVDLGAKAVRVFDSNSADHHTVWLPFRDAFCAGRRNLSRFRTQPDSLGRR